MKKKKTWVEQIWNGEVIKVDLDKLPESVKKQMLGKPIVERLRDGRGKLRTLTVKDINFDKKTVTVGRGK